MTAEQAAAFVTLRFLAAPGRLRVRPDPEGFPILPGRYGQVEWYDGRELGVYTARPRPFDRLWAIPGVRRHQTGDQEMRALFPPEALAAVAGVIGARRRPPASGAAHLPKFRAGVAYRGPSRVQARGEGARVTPYSRPARPRAPSGALAGIRHATLRAVPRCAR